MSVSDVISQLKSLKEIEPNENWVVSVREEILTKAPFNDVVSPIYAEKPSKMDNLMYIYESISRKYRFMPSMASMSIILLIGSFVTVTAAKTSLPGDPLYAVKIANENLVLAVTSDEDKPGVEMEIAGKRLEELTEISKKASDAGQQQKVEQLVKTFEEKVVSANDKMSKISQKSGKKKVAQVARQLNDQTTKYSELLAKTTETLPTVVKEKVTDQIASAIVTTEKANMDSLLILAESNDKLDEKVVSDEEMTDMILKKVEQINENSASTSNEAVQPVDNVEDKTLDVDKKDGTSDVAPDTALQATSTEPEVSPIDEKSAIMNSITENLNNNNIIDAVKGVAQAQQFDIDQNTANIGTANNVTDDTQNSVESDVNEDKTNDTVGSGDGKINNVITPVPVE
ncbi:MAG: DUF5667 domain-containing protein [Candidatus Paceibacterota bacterium]|jgi:hypothetical protein